MFNVIFLVYVHVINRQSLEIVLWIATSDSIKIHIWRSIKCRLCLMYQFKHVLHIFIKFHRENLFRCHSFNVSHVELCLYKLSSSNWCVILCAFCSGCVQRAKSEDNLTKLFSRRTLDSINSDRIQNCCWIMMLREAFLNWLLGSILYIWVMSTEFMTAGLR